MSNIIKAEYVVFEKNSKINRSSHNSNVSNEDLYDIYNQKESILKEAHEKAEKLVNELKIKAYNEIAENKKRGYEEGYKAGFEAGKNKGYSEGYETGKINANEAINEENRIKINEIMEMIEKIEEEKQSILEKYEKGLTELSIEIAEKIIRQEIDSQDEIVSRIIGDVIKSYRNIEWIKINISSEEDLEAIQGDKDLVQELNKIAKDIKIEISEQLEKGSVIIETPDGIIDGSINTQLKNLKEMVLNKNAG